MWVFAQRYIKSGRKRVMEGESERKEWRRKEGKVEMRRE